MGRGGWGLSGGLGRVELRGEGWEGEWKEDAPYLTQTQSREAPRCRNRG